MNAYVTDLARAGWDFEDETPGNDARGFAREGSMPPEVETHLVNAVLTNGARYYVDHAHPEFSTPECIDPLEAVLYDKAGEEVLRRSMEAVGRSLPPGQSIVVYKNNSDSKGNSYGTHENYLMDRAVPFARIAHLITPHFVTRQIFTGAGKVGSETPGSAGRDVAFQISQRSEFFEEEIGLETTLKRPIVNTRDEPHADPQRYRRLHVIVGDANLAEVATFLKMGTTALVLALIEDDAFDGVDLALANPVQAIRQVPSTPPCRTSSTWPTAGRSRPWPCSGSSTDWPASTPRTGASSAWATRPWARWCSSAGRTSSTASRPTPPRWPDRSTGRPSSSCSRPIASVTASTGTTADWPPWTSSTTTFAPSGPCSPGWTPSTWSSGRRPRRRHRAPPTYACLLPGAMLEAVGLGGGQRQLGFAGLRPGDRPAAARPYDGSASRNSRTCRGVAQRMRHAGGVVGTVERLGE